MAAPVDAMDVEMSVNEETMDVPVRMEDNMNLDMADVPANVSEPAEAIEQEHTVTSAVKFVPRILRIVPGKGTKAATKAATKEEDVEMTEDAGAGPSASGLKLESQAQLDGERDASLARYLAKRMKNQRRNERKKRAKARARANRVVASPSGSRASGSRIGKTDAWRTAKPPQHQGELSHHSGKWRVADRKRTRFMAVLERRGHVETSMGGVEANAPELDADLMDCFKAWNLGSNEEEEGKGKGKEVAGIPSQNPANGHKAAEKDAAEISSMLGAMKLGGGHAAE